MSLYPAIKGEMGDWTYYLSSVSMREAVKHFRFAHEIVAYTDLDQIIQRELSTRSRQIRGYLESNEQRLFGALTVAVYGGKPRFSTIALEATALIRNLDGRLGVLSFDGEEQYYVLDGQHRLAALKDLAQANPNSEVLNDEISIILVAHNRDAEGIQRARRLFTNLNRYAAKTSKTVNIVLDEDDPYAIITRDLLRDQKYLKQLTKVTKGTINKTLATGESLSATADKSFLFTITTFYECNKALLNGRQPQSFADQQIRPPDQDLEFGYESIRSSWDALFESVSFLRSCKEAGTNLDLSRERSLEGGHALARPIGIRSFCEAIGEMAPVQSTWTRAEEVTNRFASINTLPWVDLIWKRDGKMMFGKDRTNVATGLWKLLLGVEVDRVKIESDWLAFVDPDRSQGTTLEMII